MDGLCGKGSAEGHAGEGMPSPSSRQLRNTKNEHTPVAIRDARHQKHSHHRSRPPIHNKRYGTVTNNKVDVLQNSVLLRR